VTPILNSKSKTQNSRKAKVAHLITRLELGGAQQNTLYCCANHDRRKFDVLLICGEGGYLDEEAGRMEGCKTFFLPELKHAINPFWDLIALNKITSILKQEKPDLVHTHSSKAGILGRWAAKRAQVPFILHTVHGWGFYPGQFPLFKWLYQSLERWAARFTDVLITVSEENKRTGLLAGIGRESQYQVIHSGIDVKKYKLPVSQSVRARLKLGNWGRPTVLVLSNFKKQKSPLDVVNTAKSLVKPLPDALFLWAGDGELRGEVEKRIRLSGLENNFRLLGWRQDVAELLASCDVLLLTSIFEGLPRVVLQAMAAEKPVVATAVSGTPEAVQPGITGFLHEPGDCEGMAQSLSNLLAHRGLASKMGRAGRRNLKGTFVIGEMLQEIEKLYESFLKKRVKQEENRFFLGRFSDKINQIDGHL
jgi:glycosyltransferase involved in cell wall biosynthesis